MNGLCDRDNFLITVEDTIRRHLLQETKFGLIHMKRENGNFRRGTELEEPMLTSEESDV